MGKKVRDGQCVSLIRQYAEECYGIPHTGSVDGAIDLWMTRDKNPQIRKYFDIVEGRPEEGDIIFLKPTDTNKYGHVAIVLEDRGDGFNCLEQDGLAVMELEKTGKTNKTIGVKTAFWTWTRYAGAFRPWR